MRDKVLSKSFFLLLWLLDLHASQGNRHPQTVISRVSHLDDISDDVHAFGKLSDVFQFFLSDVRCKVDVDDLDVIEPFDLIEEMVGQSFHVITLDKVEGRTSFEKLIQLIRYIGESS